MLIQITVLSIISVEKYFQFVNTSVQKSLIALSACVMPSQNLIDESILIDIVKIPL